MGGGAGQWFSLVPADQFVADPSLDCPPTTAAPTTTSAPTSAAPTQPPTQPPTTATPSTPAPTEPTTVSSIDVEGQCTEDGSNVLATEFVVQNVRDSSVMADNGSGKLVLQKRDSSSLSASSLQKWQAAPLCNGKFKVINVGTGNAMSSGPWLYDPENKLLKSETGRWARAARKRKLKMERKVRYLKGTKTPWNWFQWDIVQV